MCQVYLKKAGKTKRKFSFSKSLIFIAVTEVFELNELMFVQTELSQNYHFLAMRTFRSKSFLATLKYKYSTVDCSHRAVRC